MLIVGGKEAESVVKFLTSHRISVWTTAILYCSGWSWA
jgi:hypothetical protein